MTAEIAGNTKSFGYTDESSKAAKVHGGGLAATGGLAVGRQLTANQDFDIGGPAKAVIGRVGNMMHGIAEGRGPGGGLPAAAGGGEAGGAAEGIGAVAEEAAPLLMAA